MHAVAALPASDSPFYKTQTVGCLVYFIICLTISSYQLDYSRKIADNERFTFSCKGLTDDYEKTLCRVAYNNGPNDLQGWLYLTTFLSPVLIMIIMSALMLRKNYTIQRNNCIVHIHQLYFLKVFLRFLFHLSVGLALFTKLWVFKTGQLILEGRYACVIGNSTVTCIDEKAKSKSKQNIVCCSLHGFLFVSSLFELVYYGYKWKRSGEDRNRQSNVSIHCGECGDCSYFIKTFNIFAGMSFTYYICLEHVDICQLATLNSRAPLAAVMLLLYSTLKHDLPSNRELKSIVLVFSHIRLSMKFV